MAAAKAFADSIKAPFFETSAKVEFFSLFLFFFLFSFFFFFSSFFLSI